MDMKFCQSCGMPLTDEILGTNADGTNNEDYCIYCYKDGGFTQDMTMEQMIDWRDRSMLGQHGSHKTVPRSAF